MQSKVKSVKEYLNEIPEERKVYFNKLRDTILANLPNGFKEEMSYPDGYHCSPNLPLPFVNIASQKNHIALYHMGIYADHEILNWFKAEYSKYSSLKLDMGKSCIRFKKPEHIPLNLIGQLMKKITVKEWITVYEKNVKYKRRQNG